MNTKTHCQKRLFQNVRFWKSNSGFRNLSIIVLGALLCAVALSVSSCDLPGGPGFGSGTLTLQLPRTQGQGAAVQNNAAGVSRAVISDNTMGRLIYAVTLTGPGETRTLEAGGGGTTISLDAGTWTIAAVARDPDDSFSPGVIVGEGSTTITVIAGRNSSARIPMKIDPAYEADFLDIYIHNEAELRRIGAAVNGLSIDNNGRTFYLENNIDLNEPWTPIGNNTAPFKAKFDGQGYSITVNGFTTEALSGQYLGLFGYTDGTEVKNLNIECNLGDTESEIWLELTGTEGIHIGALAGYADNASVFENITVSGSLIVTSSTAASGLYCGGIAGLNTENSKIRSSHVRADLFAEASASGSGVIIGGVSGVNQNTSPVTDISIEKSSFTGTVRGDGGYVYAGGIVGQMYTGKISACYASGIVDAYGGGTLSVYAGGGIAGLGYLIQRCYAWVNVSASGNGALAGGIAGQINTETLSQCYALGRVEATDNSGGNCGAGGIAGKNYQGTIEYCAALNDVISNNGSLRAHAIAGEKELGTTFTHNYAANDKDISPDQTPDPDLDGDNTTYALADFEGPADTVYGSGILNWTFGGDGWKWLTRSDYHYPVLSWQDEPPTDLPTDPPAS